MPKPLEEKYPVTVIWAKYLDSDIPKIAQHSITAGSEHEARRIAIYRHLGRGHRVIEVSIDHAEA